MILPWKRAPSVWLGDCCLIRMSCGVIFILIKTPRRLLWSPAASLHRLHFVCSADFRPSFILRRSYYGSIRRRLKYFRDDDVFWKPWGTWYVYNIGSHLIFNHRLFMQSRWSDLISNTFILGIIQPTFFFVKEGKFANSIIEPLGPQSHTDFALWNYDKLWIGVGGF